MKLKEDIVQRKENLTTRVIRKTEKRGRNERVGVASSTPWNNSPSPVRSTTVGTQKKRETHNTAESAFRCFGATKRNYAFRPCFRCFSVAAIPFEKIIKAQPDVEDDNGQAFSREPVPPIFVVLFVVI